MTDFEISVLERLDAIVELGNLINGNLSFILAFLVAVVICLIFYNLLKYFT